MIARLLTSEDLSEVLGIPVSTIRTWHLRSPDKLPPCVKLGRLTRYHPDTVQGWLKAKDAKGQRLFGGK